MFGLVNKHVAVSLPILVIAGCLFLVQQSESSQVEERHVSLQASFPQSIQSLREDISNPVLKQPLCFYFLTYSDLHPLAVCEVGIREKV